ncbi:MAG: P-II family nitrogen regulator [Alphaproteobacteria bacterium]|nr:P-II family nitrogen regulator [Alphaproteobacteria bacterium]
MKMVVAIIQPDKLDEVRQALVDAEITRITVSRVAGHGRARDLELYRGQEIVPGLSPKVRLEIAVNDDFVQPTVDAILSAAQHGSGVIGDGKIFVMPLEMCIRISNGEQGGDAI